MISRLLLKIFVPRYRETCDTLVRKKYASLEGWVSIIANILLFAIKLAGGLISGSISMIADAFHTLSDVISSIVVLLTSYFSTKPEDADHPFGHGRSDYIGSVIVAVLLGVTGFEFFKNSLERILTPQNIKVNPLIIGIIILSILTKEWMARFSLYLGRTINSQILKADGEHHRSDALSSIVVLIGVLASYYGLPFLDGLVGMVLSVMIIYAGFKIARESASEILGKAPDEEELAAIVKTAKSVDGVRGVHDIIIHNYGSRKVISLHIEISNHLTITKAHAISEQVEQVLFDEMEYFATVHIDPLDFFDHQVKEVAHFLEEIRKEAPVKISGFHDIRILRSKHKDLYFDLSIEEHLNEPAKEQVRDFYKQKIHPRFPDIHGIFIQIEPLFTY